MGACYSRVLPTKVSHPKTIAYSKEVAELLDLSEQAFLTDDFAQVFAGNRANCPAWNLTPVVTAAINSAIGRGNWAMVGQINLGDVINAKR